MAQQEKFKRQLNIGYCPDEYGPDKRLTSIYKEFFKRLVDKKDLAFFFNLIEGDDSILRAWGFLGIFNILNEKLPTNPDLKVRFSKAISILLRDRSDICYFGGTIEIETTVREHHVKRLLLFDKIFIFEPIFEYCLTLDGKTDVVVGDLFEKVLSQVNDLRVEPLLINHAQNVDIGDFTNRIKLLNSLENLNQFGKLTDVSMIKSILLNYLDDINLDKTESDEKKEELKDIISNKKNKLRKLIFRAAAILDIDFEEQTMSFLDSLANPYKDLYLIARKYKKNEHFKSILLTKLKESKNPDLISDILKAILILKEEVSDWIAIILEYVNRYQLLDEELISEMQKLDLLNENMLVNFLIEGTSWHFDFIREFLLNDRNKLDEWAEFKRRLINALKLARPHNVNKAILKAFKDKKRFALGLIADLERRDLAEYGLSNFKGLKDDELRKLCLFIIINYGNDVLLMKLRGLMQEDKDIAEYVKNFWNYLENRDWKYHY